MLWCKHITVSKLGLICQSNQLKIAISVNLAASVIANYLLIRNFIQELEEFPQMNSHSNFFSFHWHNISLSYFQVSVGPLNCLSWWSPVMWLPSEINRSCWTVGSRVRSPSWSHGVKTGCRYPPVRGSRYWRTARCSSRASRNAGKEVKEMWASTTALPKTDMACWSAARPKCSWHVSVRFATITEATRYAWYTKHELCK